MDKIKTPVQVTQELLALVSTRHERLQQSNTPGDQDGPPSEAPENDQMVKKLLDELSMEGDGVSASVDKSDPYFKAETHDNNLFRNAIQRLQQEAGEVPESLQKIFNKLLS